MFEKDEGGFDLCGTRSLGEDEFLGEVSVWLRKKSVLELNHHYDSREYPEGEGT